VRVLGLSFSGHGSSAAVVEDGRVLAAMNLERLTRVKFALATLRPYRPALEKVMQTAFGQDTSPPVADVYDVFPEMLRAMTGETTVRAARIDLVVKTQDNVRPVSGNPQPYDDFCAFFDGTDTCFDLEHHLCHAYGAYLGSSFDDAAVLTIDGRGEDLERLGGNAISTTTGEGDRNRVSVLTEVLMPNSVGGLYSSVTAHLGFREEQEGNTMALAAFGTNRLYDRMCGEVVDLLDDGTYAFRVAPSGDKMQYTALMNELCPRRGRGDAFLQEHYDLAWACQQISEDVIVHVTRALHERTGRVRLAMAGGVSLNCVANAEILRRSGFSELYVMPNAGDRGLSLAAALYGYHVVLDGDQRHPVRHDYLGPDLVEGDVERALAAAEDITYERCDDIETRCAELVADGNIIGWVQGGAEFGPRALGHRSIIADPRTVDSKTRLDEEVKRREWFRPYAPSVLAEHANDYFDMLGPSPYMLIAVNTREDVRDKVAGIVHADGSARVQTVEKEIEPRYHRLISKFYELTGIPLVLNTSFNGYGEPMVESPESALAAFHSMGLDALAIGDFLIRQAPSTP
jgi:carbamoyltransferase